MKYNFSDIFLIPNIITLFRLLLAFPIIVIFINYNRLADSNWWIFSIILLAFITDLLDGYSARRLNLVSELGKILDPLADKIITGIVVLSLWLYDMIPNYFFFIIILRDLFIFSGGVYISIKTRNVIMSDYVGKITVFTIGLFIIYVLILIKYIPNQYYLFLYLSLGMSIISVINYLIRGIRILKKYGNI